jgi:hypothetical protein
MITFSQGFKKILGFVFLAALTSPFCSSNAYAMEDEEQAQTAQIQRDAKALLTILDDHKGDAFAYDIRYSELGDRLIDFARNVKTPDQEKNFQIVSTHYEGDKQNNKLNSFRLTWLGIQLSMALTSIPKDQKQITIGVTHHIETLNEKPYMGVPMWLRSFARLEEEEQRNYVKLFSELKICHLYSQPLAVYTGKSHFSMKDSLAMAQHGIFLYCLNPSTGKGHTVHGGTIRNTNEKTQHDILHYMDQWISDKERDYTNFHDFLNKCDFLGDRTIPLSPLRKGQYTT